MSTKAFAVTYDYRCPFARNAHEHVVDAMHGGADWVVEFVPFSLTQSHIEEGGTPVWEVPEKVSDLTAIEAGLVVRDRYPERFLDVHLALFTARHDDGRDPVSYTHLHQPQPFGVGCRELVTWLLL